MSVLFGLGRPGAFWKPFLRNWDKRLPNLLVAPNHSPRISHKPSPSLPKTPQASPKQSQALPKPPQASLKHSHKQSCDLECVRVCVCGCVRVCVCACVCVCVCFPRWVSLVLSGPQPASQPDYIKPLHIQALHIGPIYVWAHISHLVPIYVSLLGPICGLI